MWTVVLMIVGQAAINLAVNGFDATVKVRGSSGLTNPGGFEEVGLFKPCNLDTGSKI